MDVCVLVQSIRNFLNYADLFSLTLLIEDKRRNCYQVICTWNCSSCNFSYWMQFSFRSIASINWGKCELELCKSFRCSSIDKWVYRRNLSDWPLAVVREERRYFRSVYKDISVCSSSTSVRRFVITFEDIQTTWFLRVCLHVRGIGSTRAV